MDRMEGNAPVVLGSAATNRVQMQTVSDDLLGRPHVAGKTLSASPTAYSQDGGGAPVTPEERFADLRDMTASYFSPEEQGMLERAFAFASHSHKGQCRKSGEPFVLHPVEVSIILADLRMDAETVCAALLHDTIEDTAATFEEISERFNPEIAQLVEGVTKITRIEVETLSDEQAATIRKMLVAMNKDIRVIVIKLADRLQDRKSVV